MSMKRKVIIMISCMITSMVILVGFKLVENMIMNSNIKIEESSEGLKIKEDKQITADISSEDLTLTTTSEKVEGNVTEEVAEEVTEEEAISGADLLSMYEFQGYLISNKIARHVSNVIDNVGVTHPNSIIFKGDGFNDYNNYSVFILNSDYTQLVVSGQYMPEDEKNSDAYIKLVFENYETGELIGETTKMCSGQLPIAEEIFDVTDVKYLKVTCVSNVTWETDLLGVDSIKLY